MKTCSTTAKMTIVNLRYVTIPILRSFLLKDDVRYTFLKNIRPMVFIYMSVNDICLLKID